MRTPTHDVVYQIVPAQRSSWPARFEYSDVEEVSRMRCGVHRLRRKEAPIRADILHWRVKRST